MTKSQRGDAAALREAIVKVREIHRPTGSKTGVGEVCYECGWAIGGDYPCPTISEINAILGIDYHEDGAMP